MKKETKEAIQQEEEVETVEEINAGTSTPKEPKKPTPITTRRIQKTITIDIPVVVAITGAIALAVAGVTIAGGIFMPRRRRHGR